MYYEQIVQDCLPLKYYSKILFLFVMYWDILPGSGCQWRPFERPIQEGSRIEQGRQFSLSSTWHWFWRYSPTEDKWYLLLNISIWLMILEGMYYEQIVQDCLPLKYYSKILFLFQLIDWLVFNANFSNISAISWREQIVLLSL
jgi:hypothetical protein